MSMAKSFFDGRVTLHCGDCLDVMAAMPENSVDAVVTDPPYHLASIVKRFATEPHAACGRRRSGAPLAASWASNGTAATSPSIPPHGPPCSACLKPGGHMLAFAAPRNQHRMICAIEDAGFEIRDCADVDFRLWLSEEPRRVEGHRQDARGGAGGVGGVSSKTVCVGDTDGRDTHGSRVDSSGQAIIRLTRPQKPPANGKAGARR